MKERNDGKEMNTTTQDLLNDEREREKFNKVEVYFCQK